MGDGIVFPLCVKDEDAEALLSGGDRWQDDSLFEPVSTTVH